MYNLKRYQEAVVCYDKVIELNPNDFSAFNNKGHCLANLKKYEDAIQCFDKSIHLFPRFFDAFYNKGLCLFNLKLFDEAVQCYEKAIEISIGKSARAYRMLAKHFFSLEKVIIFFCKKLEIIIQDSN